jgi:hypothetical protein
MDFKNSAFPSPTNSMVCKLPFYREVLVLNAAQRGPLGESQLFLTSIWFVFNSLVCRCTRFSGTGLYRGLVSQAREREYRRGEPNMGDDPILVIGDFLGL